MQLTIDIKDESLADKILWFLKNFQHKGVEIINYDKIEQNKMDDILDEKYIKENWREIGMNTHSADRDDDEYLYEAAWEFYNEKYTN